MTLVGAVLFIPGSPLFLPSDALYYQAWGGEIASSWNGNQVDPGRQIWPGKGVWPLVIAGFYFLFGPVTLPLITLNSCIVGLSLIVMQRSTRLLCGLESPFVLLLLAMTSTPILIFGPAPLRESIYWLGASLGVLAIANLRYRHLQTSAWAFVASSFLLLAVRPDAGLVTVYSIAAACVVLAGLSGTVFTSFRAKLFSSMMLAALFASFFPAVAYLSPGTEPSSVVTTAQNLSTDADNSAFSPVFPSLADSGVQTNGLAVDQPMGNLGATVRDLCGLSVATQVGCNAVRNLPNSLFGPFPWEYEARPVWIVSALSTLHFLALAVFSIRYVSKRSKFDWVGVAILTVSAITFALFASVLTNYGILIRFRATVEIMLFPLAAAGMGALFSRTIRPTGQTDGKGRARLARILHSGDREREASN